MLAIWDAGKTIWAPEMGGLGPGYEQAIQVGIVELCRKMGDKPVTVLEFNDEKQEPVDKYSPEFNAALHAVSKEFELGLSGAQAGAIKQVAHRYLTDGPRKALLSIKEQCGDNRLIQVSNSWPGKPQ